MPVNLTNMDIGTRYALQEDFENGFVGRDRQVVIQTDDPKGYRPVIMDGQTTGGKSKVALVADLTDYLPKNNPTFTGTLSGANGTFTDRVFFNISSISGYNADELKLLEITSGNTVDAGAVLRLYENSDPSLAGVFSIGTGNKKYLEGFPLGNLLWNGKEVERVNAIGENYIRFESGLQICWGGVSIPAGQINATVTLPVPYKDGSYVAHASYIDVSHTSVGATVIIDSGTVFRVSVTNVGGDYSWERFAMWSTIGRWK